MMIYMHPVACIHPVRKRAEERSVDLLGDSKRLCVICLEEIGFSNGWIPADVVKAAAKAVSNNSYGNYLLSLLE